MGAPVAYFDLLEDGVVQEVILRINEPARDSWQSLSSTCRRMCSLVGAGSSPSCFMLAVYICCTSAAWLS
jgi:hypothetical protein